jgi:hypothetical protein
VTKGSSDFFNLIENLKNTQDSKEEKGLRRAEVFSASPGSSSLGANLIAAFMRRKDTV